MAQRTCATCGIQLIGRRVRYCSDRCGRLDGNGRRCSEPGCERPHRARGYCKKHYKSITGIGKEPFVTVRCGWCDAECTKRRSDANRFNNSFCSFKCRGAYGSVVECGKDSSAWPQMAFDGRTRTRTSLPPRYLERRCVALGVSIPLEPSGRPFFAGNCKWCGAHFVAQTTSNMPRYCSKGCVRKAASVTRRARKRDAFVAPVFRARVFEMDAGRCHLCGKKVKADMVVPHPLAPVLDHVIPLGDLGTHEPSNVRLAHFICNSRKSANAANDQLILFG